MAQSWFRRLLQFLHCWAKNSLKELSYSNPLKWSHVGCVESRHHSDVNLQNPRSPSVSMISQRVHPSRQWVGRMIRISDSNFNLSTWFQIQFTLSDLIVPAFFTFHSRPLVSLRCGTAVSNEFLFAFRRSARNSSKPFPQQQQHARCFPNRYYQK